MEDNSYTKLPIENQCVHKLWKARINGYEEAIELFSRLEDRDPEWNKFSDIIKTFVVDSNAIAQEKGLEATLVFVENAAIAGRTAGDVMAGLIKKCYGAPKAKTKDIAIKITLMFIEVEKHDVVIEELVKGMDHKFPKIVSTCIVAATQAIKEFGPKVLNIKPLLKKLQSILEDRDKTVRDEAKLLAIEIHSWVGPIPLKVHLSNLKPLQNQELEVEFKKQCDDKRRPTRFLRSQQKEATEIEKLEAVNGNTSIEEIYDSEDHIDPVNILCQLGNDFYKKLESKKWQERKEGIDELEGILAKSIKLESGEYGDLVRALKTIITKDSNVVIVGIAIKCLTMLANGLKKRFEIYASACIPVLLEKFKEKKQIVVLALRDAVDAVYFNMTLGSIHEDILSALENKNPSIRSESVSFLARCFKRCTPTDLNKKMLNIFTTILIKTLNESDPVVRDHSAEALGTAWKVVSEKNIIPFLTSVDSIKLAKIKEAAEKAVIISKPLSVMKPEPKPVSTLPSNVDKKLPATNKNAVVKKSHGAVNVPSKTAVNSKLKKHAKTPGGRKCATLKVRPAIDSCREIGDDELEDLALTFCSPEILNGMTNSNWKTRLLCVQSFSEIIDQMDLAAINSQVLIKLLNKKPGIRDNNVQTQKLRLECLKKVIEKFPTSSCSMDCCVQDVASLLGDGKNSNLACQVLTAFAEVTRLDLVSNAVLMYAFSVQKIPKVQIDALHWISGAILEFGFIIEPKSLIQHIKKAVSASNSQVRVAAISVLGVLYLYMGSQLSFFFENEKPILVQQITAEFEKHQGEVPPKPIRGKKITGSAESLEMSSDDEKPINKINIRDIVPRVDITPLVTDSLINEFSDRDWNIRSNALTKLKCIIAEARFITSDLGGAREALKERICDSNARLSSNAINLLELISIAMGSSFKSYIRLYLPGVLSALGDPKTFKCQSARQCMNTWADICGYREFFGSDILLEALKNTSVTLRSELWMWLAEKLPLIPSKIVPADDLKCLLPILYSNLEDRNGSVRNNAETAILGFMKNIGYHTMYQACGKLKSSMSIKFCREKLDEIRPNLPASPIIENSKVVKSNGHAGSTRPKGSKILSKAENVISHAHPAIEKKKEEDDNVPLFQHNNLKHQRDIDEHRLKALKWNFTSPREEFVEQLREQMLTAGVNKLVITNMFHSEFKYHLKAIASLSEDLTRADDNSLALISNLDLILKWLSLRFFDTNPSVLLKGLEYLQRIFDILIVKKYILHDTEASSFVPYLVTKLGDSKDAVRNNVRAIIRQIAFIYPSTKLFQYIMDGVKSKNSRQRSECLDHLTTMIDDYGTSICQPSVPAACKELAKSIGDRDNGVRTAALNFFVAAFFVHGEALLKFVSNISPKDMGVLKERLKRASKNRVVPVASIQPNMKTIEPPVQELSDAEDDVYDEYISADEEHNDMGNVSKESSHEDSPQRSSNNSHSESENYKSDGTENTPSNNESLLDKKSRSESGVGYKSQRTCFTLDEKFMGDLEAEVITIPQLVLLPYNWPTDNDKINFGKMAQERTKLSENMQSSKPCLNVSPFSTKALIKRSVHPTSSFDPIQLLINQVTSRNIKTSNTALTKLNEMFLSSKARSMFLYEGKVSLLFYAIINQLDILIESNGIDITMCYKNVFNLCFNLCKYQEFIGTLSEQILCDLLSKLLFLLSMTSQHNNFNTQRFGRFANSIIMCILEKSSHTTIVCALLTMLYDTVKYPQKSTASYKELLMKCIWKIVKDIPLWGNELRCDPVLACIHKFLNMFDLRYWKNQQSDIPLKTCKTLLHTMTKLHRDNILKALEKPEFPRDSEMVVYIHKLIKYLNGEHRSESGK